MNDIINVISASIATLYKCLPFVYDNSDDINWAGIIYLKRKNKKL